MQIWVPDLGKDPEDELLGPTAQSSLRKNAGLTGRVRAPPHSSLGVGEEYGLIFSF